MNRYIVIELQTTKDGKVANIVNAYDTERDALVKFYTVMSAAVASDLPRHAVILIDSAGTLLNSGSFEH